MKFNKWETLELRYKDALAMEGGKSPSFTSLEVTEFLPLFNEALKSGVHIPEIGAKMQKWEQEFRGGDVIVIEAR